ncbi:hypothetical protein J4481_02755 [Candidatus Pacearchaeota archaeon]|nr:hypothetical protein [Candidatus Pacearchaeota archaeon]
MVIPLNKYYISVTRYDNGEYVVEYACPSINKDKEKIGIDILGGDFIVACRTLSKYLREVGTSGLILVSVPSLIKNVNTARKPIPHSNLELLAETVNGLQDKVTLQSKKIKKSPLEF